MKFGQRVRELRKLCELTQGDLAHQVDVTISYVSKVENAKLHHGDYPSEKFIHKVAEVLGADEDELLLLADKVPEKIRKRIRERPEVFTALAGFDDGMLDRILVQAKKTSKLKRRR